MNIITSETNNTKGREVISFFFKYEDEQKIWPDIWILHKPWKSGFIV